MKKSSIVLVVTVLFWMGPLMAQAQETHRTGACRADYEKFCKDVKAGQGRIVRCMKAHENELSPACRDQIAAEKEKAQEFRNACKPDADKFCKGIRPGHGHIISCLKSHKAELSPQCDAYFRK
jgi:Cysteine rich repeat